MIPILILAAFAAPVCAQPSPRALAEALVRPGILVATTTMRTGALNASAFGRAKQDLVAGLRDGGGPNPDLLRVCLKLLMRNNNGLLKFPLGYRKYPDDKDMARIAVRAAKELREYAASLQRDVVWGEKEHQAVTDIVYRGLKNGLVFQTRYGDKLPPTPPLSAEEEKYFVE